MLISDIKIERRPNYYVGGKEGLVCSINTENGPREVAMTWLPDGRGKWPTSSSNGTQEAARIAACLKSFARAIEDEE